MTSAVSMPEIMTVTEAAYFSRCSTDTIYKATRGGDLAFSQRKARGPIKILRDDLLRWLDFRTAGEAPVELRRIRRSTLELVASKRAS